MSPRSVRRCRAAGPVLRRPSERPFRTPFSRRFLRSLAFRMLDQPPQPAGRSAPEVRQPAPVAVPRDGEQVFHARPAVLAGEERAAFAVRLGEG